MGLEHWNKNQIKDLKEIISKFPEGGKVLDLGAWKGKTKVLFGKNWEWNGVDINPSGEGVLFGDAHNLDFDDNSFDIVISIAVFEHLHSPWVAIKEVSRVMKHGAYFFGTVAFLEPEHDNSYFHMTRNGISSLMDYAGLTKKYVKPTENWTVLNSINFLPFPGRNLILYPYSKIILALRSILIRFRILLRKGEKKDRAIKFLERDPYKFAGSVRFLCVKD
tara:strand:- start:20 stop:679 length:660 start_codon:yes stop_codon:yes gene_type:complete